GQNNTCDAGSFTADALCEALAPEMTWSGPGITADDCEPAAAPVPPAGGGATSLCAPTAGDLACIELPEGAIGPCIYAEESTGCPAEYPVELPSKRLKCGDCVGCTELTTYCAMMRFDLFETDDCSETVVASAGNGQCSSIPGRPGAPIGSALLVEGVPYHCDADVQSRVDVAVCCTTD
ncbi:MAG TPA: hypothetical protein VG755_18895, partial [Nannocystaceae bacterium]|nr:hypothetical protein [Nannocystaceae bacterium]